MKYNVCSKIVILTIYILFIVYTILYLSTALFFHTKTKNYENGITDHSSTKEDVEQLHEDSISTVKKNLEIIEKIELDDDVNMDLEDE